MAIFFFVKHLLDILTESIHCSLDQNALLVFAHLNLFKDFYDLGIGFELYLNGETRQLLANTRGLILNFPWILVESICFLLIL